MRRLLPLSVLVTVLALSACAEEKQGMATVSPGNPPATTTAAPPSPSAKPAPASTTAPSPAPTTTATPPPEPEPADPASFRAGNADAYYFTTPSDKFECAILSAATAVAGCHGTLPDSAPKVAGSGAPKSKVKPNAVQVTGTGGAGFASLGDPTFHRYDAAAKVLPYGSPLVANGFTCSISERTGVTCQSKKGHGFTVSDTAYRIW